MLLALVGNSVLINLCIFLNRLYDLRGRIGVERVYTPSTRRLHVIYKRSIGALFTLFKPCKLDHIINEPYYFYRALFR